MMLRPWRAGLLGKRFLILALIGSILPVASFAYQTTAEPWTNAPLSAAESGDEEKAQNDDLQYQIEQIDQEIILLRAELAQQNNDDHQIQLYLQELTQLGVLPAFQARFLALQHYLEAANNASENSLQGKNSANESSVRLVSQLREPLLFPNFTESSIVAVLLPLSGPYEEAGSRVLAGLTEALEARSFQGTLAVFDTALYKSVFELWEVVKYYDPAFIFGPLQKNSAEQWQALNTGIPTLYFNSMTRLFGQERALSPGKSEGLQQVFSLLNHRQLENVLVLTDASEASKKLETEFHQAWSNSVTGSRQAELQSTWLQIDKPRRRYQHQSIKTTVGQAIEEVMNAQRSKARHLWLQNLIDIPLSFTPRTRTDFDAIVSFIPQNRAIQVGPLLEFYQLTELTHIWYPSQAPNLISLVENLNSWQQAYAVLPIYNPTDLIKNSANLLQEDRTGLFYALGQAAVEIVNNSDFSGGHNVLLNTKFSVLMSGRAGQFYLLPIVYRVEEGGLERASEFIEGLTN